MVANAAYPFAFTIATVLAISSAHAAEPWVDTGTDFRLPFWAVLLFVILLGCALLVCGVVNPETAALVGLEGIVAP